MVIAGIVLAVALLRPQSATAEEPALEPAYSNDAA
jgi:hypothetical protein